MSQEPPTPPPLFRATDRVVIRGRFATVSNVLPNGAVVVRYDGDDLTRVVPAARIELVDRKAAGGG